jgi:hypothetical protein
MIYSTGSRSRSKAAVDRFSHLFNSIHAISPEGQTGYVEPLDKSPLKTAQQKNAAVMHFLGLLPQIPTNLDMIFEDEKRASIGFFDKHNLLSLEEICFIASDAQVVVATSMLGLDTEVGIELSKLDRIFAKEPDGTINLDRAVNQEIIANDKQVVSEIYTSPTGFWAQWRVAFMMTWVVITQDENGEEYLKFEINSGAEFMIRAMFYAIPQEEIDQAYQNNRLPAVAPRLDLAGKLKDPSGSVMYGPQIKNAGQPDSPWMPIGPEEVNDLVVLGIPLQNTLRMMMVGYNTDPASVDDITDTPIHSSDVYIA